MKRIVEKDGMLVISFDYSPYILSDVRLLPARRYDYLQKVWSVPAKHREAVAQFARRHGFSMEMRANDRIFAGFDYSIPDMPELTQAIPLKKELFAFQRQGVAYAIRQKRLIVGDQPGLGKTCQAIAAITAAGAFPCLVICPGSVKINWQREWEMWTGKRVMIMDDGVKRTWPLFYERGMTDVFIVNYESLKKFFVTDILRPANPETGKKAPLTLRHVRFNANISIFKSVIVDESHRVKDLKTQQTKFTKGICQGKEHILLLTGTPVVNKPRDLISQLGIIDRLPEVGGYRKFVELFCDREDRWRELNVLLRRHCFYRREKKDVLSQLPAKVRQSVLCDISTRKEYGEAMRDLETYLRKWRQATDEQVQRSMKGEIMVRIGILKNISARGKISDVTDYVNDATECGDKIILFVHLKEVSGALKKAFPDAVTILGDDDLRTRQRNIDRFQSDDSVKVIICSIKAAGVGITLTASSRVAFVELPWHPADCEQCEDRAHRIGQKDSVQCTYFLGRDTIDEWIYQIIGQKRDMSRQITGSREEIEESVINGVIELLENRYELH
ncbi:MAG: DEAD/DEAH box helicase [Tannerella sp.]|jgi:SWI/SNF-related matrix-associated actin-dependent regulator 1 of chromatin subfamily A|nr:DEAD/DEAH box helicase [Tannerella sp.]